VTIIDGNNYYVADLNSSLDITQDKILNIQFTKYEFGNIPGFRPYLNMGTITNNNRALDDKFKQAKITSIFRYAGADAKGDRGEILDPKDTRNAIAQARAIESATRKVMPIMVVYTAEASGGGGGEADIAIYDNLVKHNINLIRIVRELQKNKDIDHPKPGGIILNADFLGVLQQSNQLDDPSLWKDGLWHGLLVYQEGGINEGRDTAGRKILVTQALQEAVDYVIAHDGAENINIPTFSDDLYGYFQMQNYIIKSFGPDVVFGWMEKWESCFQGL